MHEIALFVEDFAHRQVIGALVQRIADDFNLDVRLDWRNATRGYGQVVREFNIYLRAIDRQGHPPPHLIIVATDANCKGWYQRIRDFGDPVPPAPIVHAIPDPHIERWLLLDGAAFKAVFGRAAMLLIGSVTATGTSSASFTPSSTRESLPTSADWSSPMISCSKWTSSAQNWRMIRSGRSSAVFARHFGVGSDD